MSKIPGVPHFESAKALTRFSLRLMVLMVFAALSKQGFGNAFPTMLLLAAVYCILAAVIRRERPFGPDLTHFDEAAAYAIAANLVSLVANPVQG